MDSFLAFVGRSIEPRLFIIYAHHTGLAGQSPRLVLQNVITGKTPAGKLAVRSYHFQLATVLDLGVAFLCFACGN